MIESGLVNFWRAFVPCVGFQRVSECTFKELAAMSPTCHIQSLVLVTRNRKTGPSFTIRGKLLLGNGIGGAGFQARVSGYAKRILIDSVKIAFNLHSDLLVKVKLLRACQLTRFLIGSIVDEK